MPLQHGKSRKVVNENVSRLVKEGYPHEQAVAIATNKARAYKRPKRKV